MATSGNKTLLQRLGTSAATMRTTCKISLWVCLVFGVAGYPASIEHETARYCALFVMIIKQAQY